VKSKIRLGFIFLLNILLITSAFANKQADREEFLQAYKILHAGGLYDASHLKGYLLYPYLGYERIKRNLKKTSDQAIKNYIKKYPDTWLADDLRTELLVRFSSQKKWQAILDSYQEGVGGNKAKCAVLEAKIRRMKDSQLILAINQATNLWLSGNRRPKNCNTLFSLLQEKGFIDDELVWKRIGLAINKGATSLAKSLSKYTQDKKLVSLWIKARRKPEKTLKNRRLKKKNKHTREVIAYAIKRLARKQADKARKQWRKFKKSHPFTTQEKADVESYIAVREAQDHNPYALQKLSIIPAEYRSHDAQLWMARLAIRQGDWKKLLDAIASMKAEEQQDDIWQYWKAYAEDKLGKTLSVDLNSLATNTSFYGLLMADKLNQPYQRLNQKEYHWAQLTPDIKNLKSIKRAEELFALESPKMARLGKKEWFWTLKKLNKRDKLVAAAYALEIKQPFLAIVSVSKTKDWNQTGLRFPLEYKDLIIKNATELNVDPAWVYGIMRRESAFDAKIVSSAKAKGLMQILPSTAKRVAKKLGIKSHKTADLLNPENNVTLGTAYLSQMLNKFDNNYVKATASYNAGPHRIPRWLPDFPLDAARWIESIPFNETRNYVRAVMSYTTIYDYKLNAKNRKNLRLSQRLQTITP